MRIAAAPCSFGANVCATSEPPARSRSDAILGAATFGVATSPATRGVAADAIGCADWCDPIQAPLAPASTIATPTGVRRRSRYRRLRRRGASAAYEAGTIEAEPTARAYGPHLMGSIGSPVGAGLQLPPGAPPARSPRASSPSSKRKGLFA